MLSEMREPPLYWAEALPHLFCRGARPRAPVKINMCSMREGEGALPYTWI